MNTTELVDPAPNWSQASTPDLCCPLCEYNLRGLDAPRCPECGFAFSWAELIRGKREKHPYLFEHQSKRNVWSFCKTYFNDAFPTSFWSGISPAQPVRLWRLMLYWMITAIPAFLVLISSYGWYFYRYSSRAIFSVSEFEQCIDEIWQYVTLRLSQYPLVMASITVLAWPWLTLVFLMVFSQSMRRAKIRKRHVLRVVIYGCDFGLIMTVGIGIAFGSDVYTSNGWLTSSRYPTDCAEVLAAVCAALTLHRVSIAYKRYLRFHLPFVTVLTSQVMVFMVALIVYLQAYQAYRRW